MSVTALNAAIDGAAVTVTLSFLVIAGGEGAPSVSETVQNAAINGAAVSVLAFLVSRDLQSLARDRRIIEREESLARLQVRGTFC